MSTRSGTGPAPGDLDPAGRWAPRRFDAVFATVVALGSALVLLAVLGPLAPTLGLDITPARSAAIMIMVAVQGVLLYWRRTRPVSCLLAVVVLQVALAAVIPTEVNLRLISPLLATYAAGTRLPVRRLAGWVIAAAVIDIVGSAVARQLFAPRPTAPLAVEPVPAAAAPALMILALLVTLLSYLASALFGVVVANRRTSLAREAERAAAVMREQAAGFERTARAERARMARELHDIAAHHLSGLVVQAAAAERLIETDPGAAKEATRSIRSQGKEALNNLRLVVGVLRDSAEQTGNAGPAGGSEMISGLGVGSIQRLVDHAHRLDQEVVLEVRGESRPLPPVADVTAYRIVQEALSNARRHATGAAVRVVIAFGERELRVVVTNAAGGRSDNPTDRGSGYGLLGMRERAALAGGSVAAGPSEDGGWSVSLVVPIRDRFLSTGGSAA